MAVYTELWILSKQFKTGVGFFIFFLGPNLLNFGERQWRV